MSTLYLFRGIAATGKTTLTDLLSQETGIPVLRKDDIYDPLVPFQPDHSTKNSAAYDILAKILQTNVITGASLIMDIALAHTPYVKQLLSKVNFGKEIPTCFLCTCSDEKKWAARIEERIENPTPNQLFTSVAEAKAHYDRYEIVPMDGEIVLDSARPVKELMETVRKFG